MANRAKQGAVDVVHVEDSLNRETLESISKLIDECLNEGQPRIVVNMDRVPLLDSAGLELLLDTRDRCLLRGGLLKLAAPNQLCRDILQISDVASQIEIFEDTISAAGSFAQ